jgi:hypothetical protein
MEGVMIEKLLWIETLLLFLLLIAPTVSYFVYNQKQRHKEILSGISSKNDEAIKIYFEQFHPAFAPHEKDIKRRFDLFYKAYYGSSQFIFPFLLFMTIAAVLIYECQEFFRESIRIPFNILERPEAIFVFSVFGAYLWVVNDHIAKWWNSDLTHKDLYWASFRFALSVPMGYAVTRILGKNADLSLALAFFLGAFPLNSLLAFFRRFGRSKLGMNEEEESTKNELLKLQGIDGAKASYFSAEGITTICQLAYADPIRLTIRTNLGYSYIIDCISQALLMLYTDNKQGYWQELGLRGGFELTNLISSLKSDNPTEIAEAEAIIKSLSIKLAIPEAAVKNILWEVTNDPYMEFIYLSWTGGD